jgi:branched-chain amino acid aminotransferase
MEIKINEVPHNELKPKPTDESKLGFGKIFSDHMFQMFWNNKNGWHEPQIKKFEPFLISPAAIVLHYGIEIFEGMKAYRTEKGEFQLFRPRENLKRMNSSAERLVMPKLDIESTLEAMKKLVNLDRLWIPKTIGTSLYIRPTMIGIDEFIGVHPAEEVKFFIITGPVGAYYATGFSPVDILVEKEYVRASKGGTGYAKAGGNYAASLLAFKKAKEKGFAQVLWLDSAEKKYVEEVGTMNQFFVFDDEIVTAPLKGTILPGITRKSVLEICRDWGLKVSERMITINEVIENAKSGKMKEAFGTGTAAVVTAVGSLNYEGVGYIINEKKVGKITQRLYDYLTGIQYGKIEDKFGWVEKI